MTFQLGRSKDAARGSLKATVSFAAALILAAQLLAISHYHQADSAPFNAHAQIVTDDGLCALCALAFHLPLNPAATPMVQRPQVDVRPADRAERYVIASRSHSLSLTRAPPTVAV